MFVCIGLVTLCPVCAGSSDMSCATAALLFDNVTTKPGDPARTYWTYDRPELSKFGTPVCTYQFVSLAESVVVGVSRPQISTPAATTFTVWVPLVKPGAETVIVALPVTFSTPWM